MFLGGFKSDMTGTKALALDAHCRARGRAFVRFDYFGHGASSGDFVRGTIGRWLEDACAVLDEAAAGPQVLVGSSMGGWIAQLLALARPERVKGLVLVAAATDFTERLMWDGFGAEARATLLRERVYRRPSAYAEDPYPITLELIEEGRHHLLLDRKLRLGVPVRLLHGMKDPDVPWRWSLKLAEHLEDDDVRVTLIKDGDHRLSRPADIARLCEQVEELCSS
ncbi:MAG: alpha/beta hydrolase [Alphaproteobacteria bacterium]|nr:alpha/beta hydrolase [Alphaproteobacteria bacterium]